MSIGSVVRTCTACTLIATTALWAAPVYAGRGPSDVSELSALSALPVAMSVAAPALLLSGTASLAIVSVEASAEGVVWVVERASDGARATLRFARNAAGGLSLAVGETITVLATSTGWILCSAGKAIAFVPMEVGGALLHSQRISR